MSHAKYHAIALPALIACLTLLAGPRAQAATVLSGTIVTRGSCATNGLQVWLIQERKILYQIQVPKDGHFEMQAPAGEFTLVAASSNGCTIEQPVQLRSGETAQVKLNLAPGV